MRALVVYESMYGNTHEVATAIGDGLGDAADIAVDVVSLHDVSADRLDDVDLLVVGGPTHAHGMSREATRQSAEEAIAKPDNSLSLDPDAVGDGVREWLQSIGESTARAAAFDTRVDISPMLSGRASRGIGKQLRHHGYRLVADPESFLVTKDTHLEPDEHARARAWGAQLGRQLDAGGH